MYYGEGHGFYCSVLSKEWVAHTLTFFLTLIFLFVFSTAVQAATRTWQCNNGNFSNPSCWTTGIVPGSADIATFNSSGTNCTIDTTVNIAGLNMMSSYNGIITQNAAVTIGASSWLFNGGTFNGNTSTLIVNSGFSQGGGTFIGGSESFTILGSFVVSNGTFNGGSMAMQLNGTVTNSGGTFTASSGVTTLTQNWTYSAGTFNHNNGTIQYTGSASPTLNFNNKTLALNHFTINKASGTVTFTTANMNLNGNFTLTAGNVIFGANTLTVAGNWVKETSGTVNLSNSTVILNGTNQSISGSQSFYNLTKTVTATDTLTFTAATTQTIIAGGTLTLNGTSGQFLKLRSSSTGIPWNITNSGTLPSLTYLDVEDSNNLGATVLTPTNSYTSGNNTNWTLSPGIQFTSTSSSVSESTSSISIGVSLTASSNNTVSVNVAVDNSSTAIGGGVDYTLNTSTLSIPGGQGLTSGDINLTVTDNMIQDPSKTIVLNLLAPTNAVLANNTQYTYTILDSDGVPSLSINNLSLNQSGSGVTTATFTVSLNHASATNTITVNYATADNTATVAANDYISASGTLTFNPLDTSKTIAISVPGNAVVKPDVAFFVNLSNASNASIFTSQGIGTIHNTYTAPAVLAPLATPITPPVSTPTTAPNPTPVAAAAQANAGPDRLIVAGKSVRLDGTASTGSGIQFHWAIESGDPQIKCSLIAETASTPLFSCAKDAGTLNVRVELTISQLDSNGNAISLSDTAAHSHMIVRVLKTLDQSNTRQKTFGDNHPIGVSGASVVAESSAAIGKTGDIRKTLAIGDAVFVLPTNTKTYTFVSTHDDHLIISATFDDGTSQIFFANVKTADLIGSLDLDNPEGSVTTKNAAIGTVPTKAFNTIQGSPDDQLGSFLEIGDINGDGNDEILVASPGCSSNGCVYIYDQNYKLRSVIFGDQKHPIYSVFTRHFLSSDKSDLFFGPNNPAMNNNLQTGQNFSVKQTISAGNILAGLSTFETSIDLAQTPVDASLGSGDSYLAAAFGDVNGDGKEDLILATASGNILIYFGPISTTTTRTAQEADVTLVGGDTRVDFGQAVAVGDVTGDGIADIVVGAPGSSNNAGMLYIIPGMKNWDKSSDLTTAPQVMTVTCPDTNDRCGSDIALFDANGTGVRQIHTVKAINDVYQVDLAGSIGKPVPEAEFTTAGGCSLIPHR